MLHGDYADNPYMVLLFERFPGPWTLCMGCIKAEGANPSIRPFPDLFTLARAEGLKVVVEEKQLNGLFLGSVESVYFSETGRQMHQADTSLYWYLSCPDLERTLKQNGKVWQY